MLSVCLWTLMGRNVVSTILIYIMLSAEIDKINKLVHVIMIFKKDLHQSYIKFYPGLCEDMKR